MFDHKDLHQLHAQSLKMQSWIRQQTFSPEMEKTLRRVSSWEVSELILKINQPTFRGRHLLQLRPQEEKGRRLGDPER